MSGQGRFNSISLHTSSTAAALLSAVVICLCFGIVALYWIIRRHFGPTLWAQQHIKAKSIALLLFPLYNGDILASNLFANVPEPPAGFLAPSCQLHLLCVAVCVFVCGCVCVCAFRICLWHFIFYETSYFSNLQQQVSPFCAILFITRLRWHWQYEKSAKRKWKRSGRRPTEEEEDDGKVAEESSAKRRPAPPRALPLVPQPPQFQCSLAIFMLFNNAQFGFLLLFFLLLFVLFLLGCKFSLL